MVVARQKFAEGQPTPAIQLPAFGLVAELKDPEKMQADLRRTFQSLIGFLNIVGAMNGQPQLDLDMEKAEAAQFVTSSYLPDPNAKVQQSLKINYNFSPSIAFAGSRFVVASTKALRPHSGDGKRDRSTCQRCLTESSIPMPCCVSTRCEKSSPITVVQLVAQNMLKDGHSKEEAESESGIVGIGRLVRSPRVIAGHDAKRVARVARFGDETGRLRRLRIDMVAMRGQQNSKSWVRRNSRCLCHTIRSIRRGPGGPLSRRPGTNGIARWRRIYFAAPRSVPPRRNSTRR